MVAEDDVLPLGIVAIMVFGTTATFLHYFLDTVRRQLSIDWSVGDVWANRQRMRCSSVLKPGTIVRCQAQRADLLETSLESLCMPVKKFL